MIIKFNYFYLNHILEQTTFSSFIRTGKENDGLVGTDDNTKKLI